MKIQNAPNKHEFSVPMFHGRPMDMSPAKLDTKIEEFSTPMITKPSRQVEKFESSNPRNSDRKVASPVSVYDDDD